MHSKTEAYTIELKLSVRALAFIPGSPHHDRAMFVSGNQSDALVKKDQAQTIRQAWQNQEMYASRVKKV